MTTLRASFLKLAIASAALVLLVVGASVYQKHPATRTLLVLPLDNFTGDARVDLLADARTDDLIAALGAASPEQLRVIDRLTAAKFKRSGECILKIGRQVHADYVFVGSISPSEQGPRLSGGVFRVADNTQVWTTGDTGVSLSTNSGIGALPNAIAAAVTAAR